MNDVLKAMKDEDARSGDLSPMERTAMREIERLEAENKELRHRRSDVKPETVLLARAMLCLSGFIGEGLSVEGYEDPMDVWADLSVHLDVTEDEDVAVLVGPLAKHPTTPRHAERS